MMPSFLSRIGRSNILLAEVERQLLVQAGELRIGDSRRFKHPLGGAHSDGTVSYTHLTLPTKLEV